MMVDEQLFFLAVSARPSPFPPALPYAEFPEEGRLESLTSFHSEASASLPDLP